MQEGGERKKGRRLALGRSSKGRKRDHELLGVVLSPEQQPKELAGDRKLPENRRVFAAFFCRNLLPLHRRRRAGLRSHEQEEDAARNSPEGGLNAGGRSPEKGVNTGCEDREEEGRSLRRLRFNGSSRF